MLDKERARTMRADGVSLAAISEKLGISLQWAYKIAGNIVPGTTRPLETDKTVVRYAAYNGGCSSRSGMAAISLPRIPTLHGALPVVAAAGAA